MSMLVAVDPGKQAGIAVFRDKHLLSVGPAFWPDEGNQPNYMLDTWKGHSVVCEIPQNYRGSVVSTQSLLTLAFGAGYLVGRLQPSTLTLVKPRIWKGQVPKEIDHARTRRILSSSEHLALDLALAITAKSQHHNMLDAIGIGLLKLGRRNRI